MEKHNYSGKNKEEAIQNAKEDLQEIEENLFIRDIGESKAGLFKLQELYKTSVNIIEGVLYE